MEYEYHIKGCSASYNKNTFTNANASANLNHNTGKCDVFLHPTKCSNCNKYFPDMEDQVTSSINHEIQESLVCDILRKDEGYYKNEWFDNTSRKQSNDEYTHNCKKWWQFHKQNTTLYTSGYFR